MEPAKGSFVSTKPPDPHRHRGPPVKPPRVGHPVRGSCIGKRIGWASPPHSRNSWRQGEHSYSAQSALAPFGRVPVTLYKATRRVKTKREMLQKATDAKIKGKPTGVSVPHLLCRGRAFVPTDSRGRLSQHQPLHTLSERALFTGEDDFGMEEGSGDAGGDGEEFGLAGEDFDLAGAGKFWEVDGSSAANAGGGGFVGGDGGKLGQELAGMDE